jgi:hypothetical protein
MIALGRRLLEFSLLIKYPLLTKHGSLEVELLVGMEAWRLWTLYYESSQ